MNIHGYPTLKLILQNQEVIEYNLDNKQWELKYFIEKNVFLRLPHYNSFEEYN